MTVTERDLSNEDGAPVTLYEFSRRSTPTLSGVEVVTYWRYASTDRDIEADSNTFLAVPISDDGVRQSGDTAADQLTVVMPASAAVPSMFVGSPPSDPISLVIMRTHNGEPDHFSAWAGVVGLVARSDDLTARVVCNTLSATLDRRGLRLSWGRQCPHDLYGFECKADPHDFYRAGVVTALNGAVITADEYASVPNGRFSGGFVEWLDSYGHAERRAIIAHEGASVRVLGATDGTAVSDTVWAFFGCARNRNICKDVFNNLSNYGGHAYMPDKNPFSGDIVF